MNYTITITGEKHELADGLAILKAMMGEQLGGGQVSAELQPTAAPLPQPAPQYPAPVTPATPVQMEMPPTAQYHQPPTVQYQQPAAVPTQPAAPQYQTPPQAPAAVPTAPTTYTMDQLAVAATQLMDAGKQPELLLLLNNTFGVPSLMALPKERYGEFATQLRQMGAKI